MANLFRKKPINVEAIQYVGGFMSWHDIRDFVGKALFPYMIEPNSEDIMIETEEGRMRAHVGDWIVKGSFGEFWPVKKEIFEATYEAVES